MKGFLGEWTEKQYLHSLKVENHGTSDTSATFRSPMLNFLTRKKNRCYILSAYQVRRNDRCIKCCRKIYWNSYWKKKWGLWYYLSAKELLETTKHVIWFFSSCIFLPELYSLNEVLLLKKICVFFDDVILKYWIKNPAATCTNFQIHHLKWKWNAFASILSVVLQ